VEQAKKADAKAEEADEAKAPGIKKTKEAQDDAEDNTRLILSENNSL